MKKNNHVTSFLDYYTLLESSPNYAVLLRGNWGSGKTWFIKDYISNQNVDSSRKFLFVSLYGINSVDDIEKAFYKELHPFLASKGFKIAGALLKGLLKTTIKFDYDSNDDGRNDTGMTVNLPDENLIKSLQSIKDCVLIFDDLERCHFSIPIVLGYINQLIENEGLKAILLANEQELEKNFGIDDSKRASYRIVKEKLIGKTFEIKTDVITAINSFIGDIQSESLTRIFDEKKEIILNIFERSTYNNLRHLRQSILDFERFYELLPQNCFLKKDLANVIIEIFFAISIEIKAGIITAEDVKDLTNHYYLLTKENKDEENSIVHIYKKYGVFGRNNPLNSVTWMHFFKYYYIDQEETRNQIESSSYYYNENLPIWHKLYSFFSLEDGELDVLVIAALNDLKHFSFKKKEDLIYTMSILMFLSDNEIIEISTKDLFDIGLRNVNNMKSNGNLNLKYNEKFRIRDYRNIDDLGRNVDEFNKLLEIIEIESESTKDSSLEKAAQEVVDLLVSDIDKLEARLVVNIFGTSDLHDIPIFKYIEVSDFVEKFWTLSPESRNHIGYIISNRYEDYEYHKKLHDELKWLKEFKDRLVKDLENSNRKLTVYLINKRVIPKIQSAIEKLEGSYASENE
jgi:hypothetical protein